MAGSDSKSIDSEIVYLARSSRYADEKPYTTSFPVDDIPGAQVDNHEWESHPTEIADVRGNLTSDLDVHGFQYVVWDTGLGRDNFNDPGTVTTRYYAELASLLKHHFPRYKKVAFFDHAIRSRDIRYPVSKGAATTVAQPFRFAHVDYTENGAKLKLQDALGQSAEERLKDRCDVLNIWRLLNDAPTRDWPLAFCDWRSVDPHHDLMANDIVYPGGLGEDCFLQHNPGHKWWYLENQSPSEVVVFRNVCITEPGNARGFHCAFHNPAATEADPLRESIEVRLAAWY